MAAPKIPQSGGRSLNKTYKTNTEQKSSNQETSKQPQPWLNLDHGVESKSSKSDISNLPLIVLALFTFIFSYPFLQKYFFCESCETKIAKQNHSVAKHWSHGAFVLLMNLNTTLFETIFLTFSWLQ